MGIEVRIDNLQFALCIGSATFSLSVPSPLLKQAHPPPSIFKLLKYAASTEPTVYRADIRWVAMILLFLPLQADYQEQPSEYNDLLTHPRDAYGTPFAKILLDFINILV